MPFSFCSAQDLAPGIPLDRRFQNAAGLNLYDRYRFAVTQSMASYTRRNWDYNAAFVEYFDSPRRQAREELKIYPTKIPFDTTVTPTLRFSYTRQWDSTTTLVYGTDYFWDDDRKCFFIDNAYALHPCPKAYQLTYAGGLKPLLDIDGNASDVYDCSGGYDLLQMLCIQEATDRILTFTNLTQGEQQHGALRNRTIEKKRIAGLLPEVARQLETYRKLYVARA